MLTKNAVLLNVCDQQVSAKIRDCKFVVNYDFYSSYLTHEAISLKGWPVCSRDIKVLLEDVGMKDVAVMDYYKTLYGNSKPEKLGFYDIIVARKEFENIEIRAYTILTKKTNDHDPTESITPPSA